MYTGRGDQYIPTCEAFIQNVLEAFQGRPEPTSRRDARQGCCTNGSRMSWGRTCSSPYVLHLTEHSVGQGWPCAATGLLHGVYHHEGRAWSKASRESRTVTVPSSSHSSPSSLSVSPPEQSLALPACGGIAGRAQSLLASVAGHAPLQKSLLMEQICVLPRLQAVFACRCDLASTCLTPETSIPAWPHLPEVNHRMNNCCYHQATSDDHQPDTYAGKSSCTTSWAVGSTGKLDTHTVHRNHLPSFARNLTVLPCAHALCCDLKMPRRLPGLAIRQMLVFMLHISGDACTMQQFMWQVNITTVAHLSRIALTCWMRRIDLSYHRISPRRLEEV